MLITRCPHCLTSFRIRPEQLNLRGGRVRCGHCQQPFSALSSLEEMAEEQAAARLAHQPETPAPATADTGVPASMLATQLNPVAEDENFDLDLNDDPAAASAPAANSSADTWPAPSPAAAQASLDLAAHDNETPEAPEDALMIGDADDELAALDNAAIAADPEIGEGETVPQLHTIFLDEDLLRPSVDPALLAARRQTRLKLWAANLALLVSGCALAFFALRVPLTSNWPGLREPLTRLCAQLGCELPYPKYAADISLEGYTLSPVAGKTNIYHLSVTLRNESRHAAAWPQLDLALTDRFERTLARRVLEPEQWLPAEEAKKPAFEANSELTAHILLSGDIQPEGYRIGVFYR